MFVNIMGTRANKGFCFLLLSGILKLKRSLLTAPWTYLWVEASSIFVSLNSDQTWSAGLMQWLQNCHCLPITLQKVILAKVVEERKVEIWFSTKAPLKMREFINTAAIVMVTATINRWRESAMPKTRITRSSIRHSMGLHWGQINQWCCLGWES